MSDDMIEAAGGLVLRRTDAGAIRVLVAHRPRYDDWSLPKGKADSGESPEETAVREVEEETGVRARIIAPVAEVEYTVSSGRPKIVRYFAMRPMTVERFEPNDEVDEVRWLSPKKARRLLSYDHDRELVAGRLGRLLTKGTVWLVRHAAAGDRSKWDGDDRLRPVTKKGAAQSDAIAAVLAPQGVDAIYTSPYLRCRQTVEPLGAVTGLDVVDSEHLVEGADGHGTIEWLVSMAGQNVVACSHGDVIPDVLDRLDRTGVELRSPTGSFGVKKGSIWILAVEAGAVTSATYQPPPPV